LQLHIGLIVDLARREKSSRYQNTSGVANLAYGGKHLKSPK